MDYHKDEPGSLPGEELPDPGLTADRDTADIINPDAPDPIPTEVTDPDDPSWVDVPAEEVQPVDPARLLPPLPSADAGMGEHLLRDQQLPASHANHFPDEPQPPIGHSPDCTTGDGWCGEEAHCPPPYTGALPGTPYPPESTPPPTGYVGTSYPDAPGGN